MLDQKPVKIGETEFVIQQLPTSRGIEVGLHLTHVLMGAAEGVGNIRDGEDFLDAEYNPAQMASGLMSRIHERDTPTFVRTLVRESLIVPDPGEQFSDWYEMHFSANYEELFQLVAEIIGHNNYADLVKKRIAEVMGILSGIDGKAEDSTRSTKAQS